MAKKPDRKIISTPTITWDFSVADEAKANLANQPEATVMGRALFSGTGIPEPLTPLQLMPMLLVFSGDSGSSGASGLVPAPPAGSGAADEVLHAHGTFAPVTPKPLDWLANVAATAPAAGDGIFYNDATQQWETGQPPGAGSGSPTDAHYIMRTTHASLSNSRALADTVTVAWDYGTAGQAQARVTDNGINNAKLSDMGDGTFKGRATGAGAGDPQDLSFATLAAALGPFTGATASVAGTSGMVPAPAAGQQGLFLQGGGGFADPVPDGSITNAKLRTGTTRSVIGRSAASDGAVADIAAANDGDVLVRDGTTIGFGKLKTISITDGNVSNAKLGNMADTTVKGRAVGAGAGVPTDLSATQLAAILATVGGAANGLNGIQLITATGTYTPTAGTTKALVIGQAPGGGGGGLSTAAGPGAAGAGAAGETRLGVFTISGNVSVTIGAPGAGGGGGPTSGTTGGDVVFGALMTCKGGTLGNASTGATTGASGTTPTGSGGIRLEPTDPAFASGSTTNTSSTGGSCMFGQGGYSLSTAAVNNGRNGGGYGGGGSGGVHQNTANGTGGDGAPGMFLILEFKQ